MIVARRSASTHHYSPRTNSLLSSVLALLLVAPTLNIVHAQAQTAQTKSAQSKNCECEFDTKDYEAYGTNGACGIFMYNKARTCEVSFAGTGANSKLLKDLLGDSAVQNQFAVALQIFERYVAYGRGVEKDPKLFADANFIERSMVVLERAALFRESSVGTKLPLKDIDALFVNLSKESSKRIAETFAGTGGPFTIEMDKDVIFFVGRGHVELNFHKIAKVRVVYFSEETR